MNVYITVGKTTKLYIAPDDLLTRFPTANNDARQDNASRAVAGLFVEAYREEMERLKAEVAQSSKVEDLKQQIAAFEELKEAGPGAVCEECGHFAGRHADNAGEDKEKCHFPYTGPPCPCAGMVWQGYRFVMQIGSGPAYVKEKV